MQENKRKAVTLAHGGGGRQTNELIHEIFKKYFGKQKLVLGFTLRVREIKDLKFTSRFLA